MDAPANLSPEPTKKRAAEASEGTYQRNPSPKKLKLDEVMMQHSSNARWEICNFKYFSIFAEIS